MCFYIRCGSGMVLGRKSVLKTHMYLALQLLFSFTYFVVCCCCDKNVVTLTLLQALREKNGTKFHKY